MTKDTFKTIIGDSQLNAYVRWGFLVFMIGASWATLKADVRSIRENQERTTAYQIKFNELIQQFMDSSSERTGAAAAWYERLVRDERDIEEMQLRVDQLTSRRPLTAPQEHWEGDVRRRPK